MSKAKKKESSLIPNMIAIAVSLPLCIGFLFWVNRPRQVDWRSRVAADAIPEHPGNGVTQRDIDILWKGAQYMIESGRCEKVDYADVSTTRPDFYFIQDGYINIYFTEHDVR